MNLQRLKQSRGHAVRLLILTSIISACAASSLAQDSRVLNACEKCVDELAQLRAENSSLKVQRTLSDERDKLKDDAIVMLKEQRDFYKSAAESFKSASGERATANETDALRITLLRDQIADYKIELDRARREIEKLRGERKWVALFSGAVGAGITYAVTNK